MKVGLNIVKGLKGGCSSIKYLVYLNVNYYYSEGEKGNHHSNFYPKIMSEGGVVVDQYVKLLKG